MLLLLIEKNYDSPVVCSSQHLRGRGNQRHGKAAGERPTNRHGGHRDCRSRNKARHIGHCLLEGVPNRHMRTPCPPRVSHFWPTLSVSPRPLRGPHCGCYHGDPCRHVSEELGRHTRESWLPQLASQCFSTALPPSSLSEAVSPVKFRASDWLRRCVFLDGDGSVSPPWSM
jgi:hypothetical protein